MEYKDYMFKVDEQLALLGIGKGTSNYNKTDRDLVANSLIMLELIEALKSNVQSNNNVEVATDETEVKKPKQTKGK